MKPEGANVDQMQVFNNKQRWNNEKCRCECKELIEKGICDKRFILNPSNCKCEWNKSYDMGEYLDYENIKCRKLKNGTNEWLWKSMQFLYSVRSIICHCFFNCFFIGISSAFINFHWYLKENNYFEKTIY